MKTPKKKFVEHDARSRQNCNNNPTGLGPTSPIRRIVGGAYVQLLWKTENI